MGINQPLNPLHPPPPYPQPACTKRGLRIFRGQGVLATLSGKLETDHVLLVFFLGHFFFYRRRKKVYSDGIVVLDLGAAAGQTAMEDSCA